MVIKLNKVKKYYGDRLVLDIDNLEIFENQKIGIVGENGAGKTTLIKIILGLEEADEGKVYLNTDYSYIDQNISNVQSCTPGKIQSIFNSPSKYNDFLSGGEKTKISITRALEQNKKLVIADEPTANIDNKSIRALEKLLVQYKGTLLLVSHDREFLNNLCDTILEIAHSKVKLYKGNYNRYLELKHEDEEFKRNEYDKYIREKQKLENAIVNKENTKNSIKKIPKRMGNSEARLHRKMGSQKAKKNLDGNIKALKSRINHLEVKEKPKSDIAFNIKVIDDQKISSKNIITFEHLDLYVNNTLLVKDINFKVKNSKKVAIIGDNGCGKTSFLREILKGNERIKCSEKISIGYFDQHQKILDDNKNIIENILVSSSYSEDTIRLNLASFGFKNDLIYKKVGVLSGGEKVKVSLCKVILSDNNTLIFDEPTNYLDIQSIEAFEKAIINTDKTVLIVSHDVSFISNVCNCIFEIKDKKSTFFNGSYNEFNNYKSSLESKRKEDSTIRERKENMMILENELSRVISQLSLEKNKEKAEKLNDEYFIILNKIKNLRK